MRIILIMLLILNLATAKKVALVIGNGDYSQGHLPNPTKDADLIAQNLRDVGFSVTVKKNLSTALKMEKAIDDFAGIVKDDDIAVIYYAGHGVQCKGKNYLIPTKATINRGGQLPSKALNLEVVIGAVSDIKLAIIMLDACRNNTYPSCTKSQTRGLVQPKVNSAGGMIVSFATAENTEASDGEEHSPYALALSKFMKQKMPIETYFREVGGEVFGSSGQRPMLKNSFYGKFSFGKGGGYVPPTPPPSKDIVTIDGIMYHTKPFIKEYTWKEAKRYCKELKLGGYSDWRIVNYSKVSRLVIRKNITKEKYLFSLNSKIKKLLPNTKKVFFWVQGSRTEDVHSFCTSCYPRESSIPLDIPMPSYSNPNSTREGLNAMCIR